MTTTIRSLPGTLALLAFPVGLAAAVAALGWVLVAAGRGELSPWWLPVAGALGALLVHGLRGLVRPDPDEDEEVLLAPADAPDLWRLVHDTATTLGATPPRHLVLTPDPTAATTRAGEGHDLVLGLTILAATTRGQLRAVVAHELGHLIDAPASQTRAHLALEALAWRGVESSALVRWWAVVVLSLHALLDGPRARAVEHLADAWSLRAATREEAVSAQRDIFRAVIVWSHADSTYVSLFHPSGLRAPITQGLHAVLRHQVPDLEAAVSEAYEHERTRPWDTHPSSRLRAARLAQAPAPAGAPQQPDPRPALDLVPAEVLLEAEGRLLRCRGLSPSGWDEVADVGGAALLVDGAIGLAAMLQQPGPAGSRSSRTQTGAPPGRARYADLLAALAEGIPDSAWELGGPLVLLSPGYETDDGDPARQERTRALVQVAAAALVEAGVATVGIRFPAYELRRADGSVIDLWAPLAPLPEAQAVTRLRTLLVEEGVDLTLPIGTGRPLPEASLAAATRFTGPWVGEADLVLTTTGMIAVPSADASPAAGGLPSTRDADRLTDRLAAQSPAMLRQREGAWELPLSQVLSARVTGRVVPRIWLRTVDGHEFDIRGRATRTWLGDAFPEQLALLLRPVLQD